MKTELSAGGIIIRNTPSGKFVLLVKDRSGAYTFPKGKIEPGESRIAAARREITEEVGLTGLTRICMLPALHYTYKRSGTVKKTVYYYVFTYDGNETPVAQAEEGLADARWVHSDSALDMIGYPESNTPLLRKALTCI